MTFPFAMLLISARKPPTYAEKRRKWKRRLKARSRDRARKLKPSRAP